MRLLSISRVLHLSLAQLAFTTPVWATGPIVPTGKTLVFNTNSQKCLSNPKSSLVVGTLAQQIQCQDTDNMKWVFVPQLGGAMIKNSLANLCLAPVKASKTSPADIELTNCDPKKLETIWSMNIQGDKFFFLNRNSNLCLSIKDQDTKDNAQLVQRDCVKRGDQLWSFFRTTSEISAQGINNNPQPTPQKPTPTQPAPTQPAPTQPAPTQPAPTQPAPTQPAPTQPAPTQPAPTQPTPTQPTPTQPATQAPQALSKIGKWSPKFDLGLAATSMAVLGNGKVLIWSACGTTSYGCHETTLMTLFEPGPDTRKKILTRSSTSPTTINTGQEYFCEATSILANGGVIVSGGVDPDRTSIADPNGNWTASSPLNIARGYAGSTLTSNGQVFILGGSWSGGGTDKMGELYTPGAGWSILKNVSASPFVTDDVVGDYRKDSHMWLFGASNGWVFHAGPAKTMHWINTSGDGSVVSAGTRGSDTDAMNGNAVMYDINKIIALGGAPDYHGRPPTNNATLIDLSNGPGSGVSARSIGGMQNPRMFAHSIVLPNGQVMVAGGAGVGAMVFSDAGAVLQPELWDPATEQFQPQPSMATARAYHSVGFLLIDGRVMLAGGQLGAQDQNVIHTDAEIFTPPYLLNADGSDATRPTITSAPASTTAGQTISVNANGATSFVLIRASSQSHSVDNDQRRIPLTLNGTRSIKKVKVGNTRADETTTLKIPDDRGIVLPGTYYLFALDDNGTPSVASMMNIQ